MIRLKTVRWKNFLATGNRFIEVKLDQESMMLVVGKNGAGKSTLIDAITFSLFGKPFKKVNKGQELAYFKMGSTVILLFPQTAKLNINSLYQDKTVKFGERLAEIGSD